MARRDEALVTIARFDTEFEASLARGALESAGIPAMVPGEGRGSLYGGTATTELLVFESDRDRAIVELRRMQIRVVSPPDHDE